MIEQEWIGIQFNLDRDMELKSWLEKYKNKGIKTDGEHIRIEFGKNELKQIVNEDSIKINLIKTALRRCLNNSAYTNIYTYLNAESVGENRLILLNGEFSKPIRIEEFENKNSILGNYKSKIESTKIQKILRTSKLMRIMDDIFDYVSNREFEQSQKMTLEIGYEDKEEWGTKTDNLNVSIQLEILQDAE